jgi:peptidoglycan LD-endopeptidase LytH
VKTVRSVVAVVAVLATSAALSTVPAGPSAAETVGTARERAAALRAQLADTRSKVAASVARYEEAEDALGVAVNQSVAITRELEAARANQDASAATLHDRISAIYKSGGGTALLASVLSSKDPQELFARAANVSAIVRVDTANAEVAGSAANRLVALEEKARANASEKIRLATVLDEETAVVNALFAEQAAALANADATVKRLVAEEQARARAEAARLLALQQRSYGAVDPSGDHLDPYAGPPGACPVGPVHSFVDTWHAPRSGGRQHQGTDVFAPKGTDAYAVVDGVVDKVGNGGLGGISLWIRGANGDRYYYAHNDVNYVTVGQQVKAGQVVAIVGNTGNAETTPSHIHFEAHPGGGAAANPFSWLAAICAG